MAVRVYAYVGPEEIRVAAEGDAPGTLISNRADLQKWFVEHAEDQLGDHVWATYVVDERGRLLLAPRRSEHVACAGGGKVRAAGELSMDAHGVVNDLTNQSTGYCPDLECFESVKSALASIGASCPTTFTYAAVFRRCVTCGGRNLVKDEWFVCDVCGADLSPNWNF